MGPLLVSSGMLAAEWTAQIGAQASMGPLLVSSGMVAVMLAGCATAPASMGPLLVSSGMARRPARHFELRVRFNGAAAREQRNVDLMHATLTRINELQWGRCS